MSERQGNLIKWKADCGHLMVCYSLEPTPTACPDCADKSRKFLATIVREIERLNTDELPSVEHEEEFAAWLKDWGITNENVVADVRQLAGWCDDARASLDHAEFVGRRMLEKYPKAERLMMPK